MRQPTAAKKQGHASATPQGTTERSAEFSTCVRWLTLGADSAFVANGLPEIAPAVWQDACLSDLFGASQYIASDLGLEADAVTFEHDSDWATFPEVGEAITAAGGEEQCLCIAECAGMNIWAVGLAAGWKKREQAARLALCIAVAANLEDFSGIAASQPDFASFCGSVGISTGNELPARRRSAAKSSRAAPAPAVVAPARAESRPPRHLSEQAVAGHRDKPFWINGADVEGLPDVLEGMEPEAVVLSTLGAGRKGLYSKADAILDVLLGGDHKEEIAFHDDPNWELFPAIGKAVKAVTGAEECQTVAVCPEQSCWAVGVGMKGKNRFAAAKAAIAAAIVLRQAELGTDVDFEENPALSEVVKEAEAARLEA